MIFFCGEERKSTTHAVTPIVSLYASIGLARGENDKGKENKCAIGKTHNSSHIYIDRNGKRARWCDGRGGGDVSDAKVWATAYADD